MPLGVGGLPYFITVKTGLQGGCYGTSFEGTAGIAFAVRTDEQDGVVHRPRTKASIRTGTGKIQFKYCFRPIYIEFFHGGRGVAIAGVDEIHLSAGPMLPRPPGFADELQACTPFFEVRRHEWCEFFP